MNKEHFSSYFLSIQNLNLDILKLISSNFTIFSPFQSPLWTVLRKPSSKWDLYMWLASNNALNQMKAMPTSMTVPELYYP